MIRFKGKYFQTLQILFILFLASGVCSVVRAGKLIDGGKPQPAQLQGFTESQCVAFPSKIKVCKARKVNSDDALIGKFVILKDSQIIGTTDASLMQSSPELFSAFYGDINNDNAPELIVVDFNGSSNGLGVTYHTINIFQDFEKSGFSKPVSVSTYDFGAGAFVYDKLKNETLILLTEWNDYEKLDPKPGLYLVGRFYRFAQNHLTPATDKPILARRLLRSFDAQRIKDMDSKNPLIPYNWLTAPATKKLKIDPEFSESVAAKQTENGTIEKIETIEETYTPDADSSLKNPLKVKTTQMIVRTESGAARTFILKRDFPDVDLPENESIELPGDKDKYTISRFGWRSRQIAFAQGLGVADYLTDSQIAALRGTKVVLISENSNPADSKIYRIWFDLK